MSTPKRQTSRLACRVILRESTGDSEMRRATLITAKQHEITIHPGQEVYQLRHYNPQFISRVVNEGDMLASTEMVDVNVQDIPIKRFCKHAPKALDDGMDRPFDGRPEWRDIQEWFIAMDPLIQECFDAELNTVRQDAQHKNWLYHQEKERTLHLESELERIRSMTAWETLKVAMAKLWGGNHD